MNHPIIDERLRKLIPITKPVILIALEDIKTFCKSQGCCRDCPITTKHSICPFRGMPSQWQNKRFKEVLEVIL